jgi:DNA-binding Xre family transcriptional regulator
MRESKKATPLFDRHHAAHGGYRKEQGMSDNATYPPVGQVIHRMLAERDWTTADLADSINQDGWTPSMLDLMLASKNPELPLGRLAAETLSEALGIDPQELLDIDTAFRTQGN